MKKNIKWFFLILWIGFIFYMSNQIGTDSSNVSGIFIQKMIEYFPMLESYSELISFFIRKIAHISEYFILGIFVFMVVDEYSIKDKVLISILSCLFLSCFDEIHQLFVPGRNGTIIDIFFDSIGFFMSIYLVNVIKFKKRHYNVLCDEKEK